MIYHAAVNDYQFPYVLDKNAELAKLFGAIETPHVYLFNKNDILVYRGAIDDNAKNANKVKKEISRMRLYLVQKKKNKSRDNKSF